MNNKSMIGSIVSLAVVVICVATIMMPVIDSAETDISTTFENEGTASYTINGVEDFSIYNTSGRVWIINGEEVTINAGGVPLVTTDVFAFIKSDQNGRYMYLRDATGSVEVGGSAAEVKFSIEYTASTNSAVFTKYTDLTGDTVDVTYTYPCTHVIEYDPNGDYTAINTEGDADEVISYYVNNKNQIIAGGAYISGELDTAYFAKGETVNVGNSSYTGSATATTEAISGYTDVYSGSTYTISITDGTSTETFTPYTVFVPKEVIGHTPSDNAAIGLVESIAPIVIVSIVVAAIGLFVTRRD